MFAITTHSADETRRLGRLLGALAEPGDVLCLRGDLGAGKTTFVQGVAAGLAIDDRITSPSFALIHHHQGRLHLRHIDLYRLSPSQVPELGLEELLDVPGVTAIEWSELLPEDTLAECLHIEIQLLRGEHNRRFLFRPVGARAVKLAAELREQWRGGE